MCTVSQNERRDKHGPLKMLLDDPERFAALWNTYALPPGVTVDVESLVDAPTETVGLDEVGYMPRLLDVTKRGQLSNGEESLLCVLVVENHDGIDPWLPLNLAEKCIHVLQREANEIHKREESLAQADSPSVYNTNSEELDSSYLTPLGVAIFYLGKDPWSPQWMDMGSLFPPENTDFAASPVNIHMEVVDILRVTDLPDNAELRGYIETAQAQIESTWSEMERGLLRAQKDMEASNVPYGASFDIILWALESVSGKKVAQRFAKLLREQQQKERKARRAIITEALHAADEV